MSMFKPMFEAASYKPSDKKFAPPTHNRQHPKDGLFVERHEGRGVNGQPIIVGLKTRRKGLATSRSKLASMSSSSHTQRFVFTQLATDTSIDHPLAPASPNPGKVRPGRHVETRRRLNKGFLAHA